MMTNFIDLTIVEPLEVFSARILAIIAAASKHPCHAMTKKGVQCRNYVSDGQQVFCYRHRTYMKNLRMTHLRRVFRAAVNMIIVHKRYINDYYMPGGKGAKMAAIEFKAMA